jgi:hypothetical protein
MQIWRDIEKFIYVCYNLSRQINMFEFEKGDE